MDLHSLYILEFPAIVEELAAACFSCEGPERVRAEQPSTTPEDVARAVGRAVSFRVLLESEAGFPSLDFPDIRPMTPYLRKEGVLLEAEDLAALARYIRSAVRLRKHIRRVTEDEDLSAIAERIPDLSELSTEIFLYIDELGNLRDKAIPELVAILRSIGSLRRAVRRAAAGYLKDEARAHMWQTDVPAERDGRIVLPLKTNFRGRIDGIVHEVSPSGATVFVEPQDILSRNNEIVAERNRYQRVVRRILRGVSEKAARQNAEILLMQEAVGELDVLYAKSVYAIHHRCRRAEHRPGAVDLRHARHPLLGDGAVPIDVSLGKSYRVLLVTGPNTGGKTVTLKTIGLLAVMNQFGMEIPALDGSTLGVFDNVLADIGDEQSIEQSLSTFSSHMGAIAKILCQSTPRSLILLDELGSGTDPAEGTAIGMALLDFFLNAGCLCAATTHHGILKDFAYSRADVENAAMDFDRLTLEPTFKLIVGIPGDSHALDIARRIGIPNAVVDNAAVYLREEQTDVSELIRRLSVKHRELERDELEQRQKEVQIREKTRETDLRELRLRQRELELREHGLRDLKKFLSESRREFEATVRELREGELTKEKIRTQANLLSEIQERIEREETRKAEQAAEIEAEDAVEVQDGMEVIVKGTAQRGRLVRRGKNWIVQTDTMKVAVDPSEVRPLSGTQQKDGVEILFTQSSLGEKPVHELDVRGMRLEEALDSLGKQIDGALVWGLGEFSVIHGKGTGILQEGIRDYLKENGTVADYHFARPEAGGFGKTIVRLRT